MIKKRRERFDFSASGATELADRIVHGAFTTEGQMVAFPLCFPAVSVPIAADESRITALDITGDGVVYGGTSGYASHLFVGMFHGVTGMVLDMGVVEGCDQTAAVCCGERGLFAVANGPAGSRAVVRKLQNTPFSLIQEWSIERFPYTYLVWSLRAERVVHATSTADRARVIGAAGRTVFRYDFGSDAVKIVGEVGGAVSGRLAALPDGSVIGRGGGDSLWRWDARTGKLVPDAGRLPRGDWDCEILWASDPEGGLLYTADAGGTLFSSVGQGAFSAPLGRVPFAPVTSLAVTFDGRVFGSGGTDMQRVFCFDPATGAITDIGVGVSTLQQRRYCYEYGAAVTGRDGQIVFGEKDDLGHLWLYFPRIKKRQPP